MGVLYGQTIPPITNEITLPEGIPSDRVVLLQSNRWLNTSNPASIGIKTMPQTGLTQIGTSYATGNLKRVQESGRITDWHFKSNSYKSLKNLNVWGNFEFRQQRHSERHYADMPFPFNGNPFIAGSDIKSSYSHQIFDFDVKISSLKLFEKLYSGLGVQYTLGDFSRLQDPRSRDQYIDFSITPGLIIEINPRNHFGANFKYRYRKDKSNTYVIKSQFTPDEKFSLFLQEGLGVYEKKIATYFDRRIKGNYLGGEIQYEYCSDNFSLLSAFNILHRKDLIEDKSQASPGDYINSALGAFIKGELKNGTVSTNIFNILFNADIGESDKFIQQLQSVTDPESGITTSHYETVIIIPSFKNHEIKSSINWTFYKLNNDSYKWFSGIEAGYHIFSSDYIGYSPPSSLSLSKINSSLFGGYEIFRKERRSLNINTLAGYLFTPSSNISISSELPSNRQIIYNQVIIPDYEIATDNIVKFCLSANYIFPLTKNTNTDGIFTILYRQYLSGSLNRYYLGISFGLLIK